MTREIKDLKDKLKKSEDERMKGKDFETKCKLLEETIKNKNPGLVVASDLARNPEEVKQLQFRMNSL